MLTTIAVMAFELGGLWFRYRTATAAPRIEYRVHNIFLDGMDDRKTVNVGLDKLNEFAGAGWRVKGLSSTVGAADAKTNLYFLLER